MYLEDMYIARRLLRGWFQVMLGNASLSNSNGIDFKLLEVGRIVGSINKMLVIPDHA